MTPVLPPFRLNGVRIRDFRAMDDPDLKLPADDDDLGTALVIAGENGCGKTSVLEYPMQFPHGCKRCAMLGASSACAPRRPTGHADAPLTDDDIPF